MTRQDISHRVPRLGSASGIALTVTEGRQRGFVLIVSLLILVILTIISISMARSFWLEEAMAGNLREKTRALNAAQSALRFAENWLVALPTNAATTNGPNCSTAGKFTTPEVCTSSFATTTPATTLPWGGVSYVAYSGGTAPIAWPISQVGGVNTYWDTPGYYIQYIGVDPNVVARKLYQITAYGYGGNQNSAVVIQSLYGVQPSGGIDLSKP